ncbi:MAG: Virion structural protein, partial [uncultured bacterium]
MFVLKAFAVHQLFTNNTVGVISPIGEISTKSMTFAREKGIYKSTISNEIALTTFTSSVDDAPIQLTTDIVDEVVTIVKYLYDKSINANGLVYRDEILQYLLSNYDAFAFNFNLGNIVTDGSYHIPEWISWESKNPVVGSGNIIKLWLSDPSFQQQYDGYEIV